MLNLLAARWDDHATSPAVSDGSTTLTYGELAGLVESTAARLRAGGVEAASSVAVALGGVAGVVGTLAVAAVGAVPAVCNAAWWARELRAALDGYEPNHTLAAAESATMLDGRGGLLVTEEADLLRVTRTPLVRVSDPPADPAGQPAPRTAAVVFSTGVWARPRPFEIPGELIEQHWLADQTLVRTHQRTTLLGMEAGHVTGVRLLLEALAAGDHLQLAPAATARPLLRRLGNAPAQRLWLGAPQATALALALSRDTSLAAGFEKAGLESIEVGNGVLRPWASAVLAQYSGAAVRERYTLTEAGGWADGSGVAVTSDGGCLHLSGPAALDPGPTGDRGLVTKEGPVIEGRVRDDFRTDEMPVRPAVVEAAIARHDDVADVAVVPRPDTTRGSIGVAVVVPRHPDHPPFLDDLREVMADLAPHERPVAQTVQARLAQTAAGHVHRRMLTYEEASR